MDLRRLIVLGALFSCVTALALPPTAAAAGGKKKAKSAQTAEPADEDGGDDAEAAEAEPEYVEPDAWERPPVEEEEPPPEDDEPKRPEETVHGDGRHVGIGLLIGYGFEHEKTFGTNPYGFGFGLRGGYTLDFGVYVGGSFSYFLGTSAEGNSGGGAGTAGTTVTASANYVEVLAEVGYDIWVSKLVLRPYIGLGVGIGVQENTVYPSPVSSFAFAPGASIFYNFDAVFIGVDLRFNLMGGNGVDGTTLSALGGMRF